MAPLIFVCIQLPELALFDAGMKVYAAAGRAGENKVGVMPRIVFIEQNNTEHVVEAEEGLSVMTAAVQNLVPGIDAECGGACACATCHVYVEKSWLEKVGVPGALEDAMLDMSSQREQTSRLSCQINITDELDGLVVHIPEHQG